MDLMESALNFNPADADLFKARISVCGVGGGGSNTIQRLARSGITGANLIAVNTDSKHLNTLDTSIRKVLIGGAITRGLGAGGFPEMGAKAAEYSRAELEAAVGDANLMFITAGMGGGTGSGAAPVIARAAKAKGALVIGVVTFPFALERVRLKTAQKSINELRSVADTLIVIDNQRLFEVYRNVAMEQAFKIADEVCVRAVKGITEAISAPGLINVDFADIKTIMSNRGLAMISVGEVQGPNRVDDVVKSTLRNKLLDVDYDGTTGIMLAIKGGEDLTLGEANQIATKLTESAAPNANVIWGARIDPAYAGKVEVMGIFTGVKSPQILGGPAASSETGGDSYGLGEL
jgi:cell division protein FtsZ